MHRYRVYIDTSVLGGCFDDEFKEESLKLIEMFRKGELIAVVSEITELELKKAPAMVQKVLTELPRESVECVELTEEAAYLANRYIEEKVLDIGKITDAQHIATASVHKVDLVVSWNFKHIVNVRRIRGYNAVNLKMGYLVVDIRSPREVVQDE